MIEASAHANGDDVFLAWRLPVTEDCWGVAIYREVYANGAVKRAGYLDNRVGFAAHRPKPGESRSSTEWPFQRYTWTDHGVSEGEEVAYWISPVMLRDGFVVTEEDQAVGVGPVAVSSGAGTGAAFFNRGMVLSQFMLRELPPGWSTAPAGEKRQALLKLKASLSSDASKLRRFLMGDLGAALAKVLRDEGAAGSEIHAALYELSDPSLIDALRRFGPRAHVVLANGSTDNARRPKVPKPYDDGNAEAAAALQSAIDLRRRMFFNNGLGHNKFLVISRNGAPAAIWTGSTNWATTGLCTQVNNGVLIEDPELAKIYLGQWQRLAADNQAVPERGVDTPTFGPELMAGNNTVHETASNGITSRVWFTRNDSKAELDEVVDRINSASDSVFFLLFEPGTKSPVVAALNALLTTRPDLHVHGVINTITQAKPDAPEGGTEVEVAVVTPEKRAKRFRLDIVQPEGVEAGLASWAVEVTRRDFLIGPAGSSATPSSTARPSSSTRSRTRW